MTQQPFAWHHRRPEIPPSPVALPPAITAQVVALMARALMVVVRAAHAEEGTDDDQ